MARSPQLSVKAHGFRIPASRVRAQDPQFWGLGVWGLGLRDFGFRGSGFRVSGIRIQGVLGTQYSTAPL